MTLHPRFDHQYLHIMRRRGEVRAVSTDALLNPKQYLDKGESTITKMASKITRSHNPRPAHLGSLVSSEELSSLFEATWAET